MHDYFRINDLNNRLGRADDYGIVNLVLDYTVPEAWVAKGYPELSAFLRVENLTNEEYVTFHSSNGSNLNGAGEYPMPPTNVLLGARMKF